MRLQWYCLDSVLYIHCTSVPGYNWTLTPAAAALDTMPTLTAARGHKRGPSHKVDYDAIWEIGQPGNISHNGQGLYSYVGDGGSNEEDIGTIRTLRPLNPSGGGLSSFEIKIVDTGDHES